MCFVPTGREEPDLASLNVRETVKKTDGVCQSLQVFGCIWHRVPAKFVIDQVRETSVPAIFGSDVFPSPIMEQIAKEGGSKFIDQLRDDDLPGGPGDEGHSYLGLMASNIEIMVPALGGNADAMIGFDTSLVFQEESKAIYPE